MSDKPKEPIRQNQAAHTRVPNLYLDIVLWLLSDVERDCVLYILRKTVGWAEEDGQRKVRDTISLSQFENGIVTDDYLFNLGINRSRNSIRKALDGLVEKDLVEPRWSCTHCWWEEGEESNEIINEGSCPRCAASLSKSYALAPLTPKKILDLLNSDPRQKKMGRTFTWDAQVQRFHVIDQDREAAAEEERKNLAARYEKLHAELWDPDLVDEIVKRASALLKGGKIQTSRQVKGFLEPVIEMQEKYRNPNLITFALQQTLEGPVFEGEVGKPTNSWYRYADKVAANNVHKFGAASNTNRPDASGNQIFDIEGLVRKRLREAAYLNGTNKPEEAREILDRMLDDEALEKITPLFDGDIEKTRYQLKLAFKQGESDPVSSKIDPYAIDFFKEWDPAKNS